VNGLDLPGDSRKTIYIDNKRDSGKVCAYDNSIAYAVDIGFACSGTYNVYFDNCDADGQTVSKNGNTYTCTDIGDQYKIDGLEYSGVLEIGNAGLSLTSDSDSETVVVGDNMTFYAQYYDISNGQAIFGADCDIFFADIGWVDMQESGPAQTYTRTFSSSGTRAYSVSCSAPGYDTIMFTDTYTIAQDNTSGGGAANVPEFNAFGLMIGLLVVVIGLVTIRRNTV
jgi:hypothetical protein